MKKLLSAALFLTLLLSACGGETLTINGEPSEIEEGTAFDVTMEAVEGTVTPTSLSVCVRNNTEIEIDSGNEYDFSLEAFNNGVWNTLPCEEQVNTDEAYLFAGERTLALDWSTTYGPLPEGRYRVVKYFFPWTEDGTYGLDDGFYLTAEFDVD